MLLRIDSERPDERRINQVVECLKEGGLIIYPTDSVYTLGCDMYNRKAYEKICRLKGLKPEKANFSLVCYDLSHVSDFTKNIKNATYKLMHRLLPGPYTFILRSSKQVSRQLGFKKPEIGLRVPNHAIPRSIVKKLGNPIFSASIKHSDEVLEFMTDPEEIHEAYANEVDIVIDGGPGGNIATTIIDYTGDEPWLVRAGMGEVD